MANIDGGPTWVAAKMRSVGENSWGSEPDFAQLEPLVQKYIVEARDYAMTIAASEDPEACYSYDDYALVQLGYNGDYYVFNTSGCSCPSPNETWSCEVVGNKEAVLKYLDQLAGPANQPYAAVAEFLRKVQAAGWTLARPAPVLATAE